MTWLKDAAEGSVPKMKESASFLSVFTKNFANEPLCALQLGFAVLMDKPIILIADQSEPIPKHLIRLAALIERVDISNKTEVQRATESIARFMQEQNL